MLSVFRHNLSKAYTPSMRHLTRGKRLSTGRMSNETWCGQVSLSVATRVADVECVACLDALVVVGEEAACRKAQLARNAER
jgi:hypothetical protein